MLNAEKYDNGPIIQARMDILWKNTCKINANLSHNDTLK
jgi:hypothetical protein